MSTDFVTGLRARPGVVRLSAEGAADTLSIRAQVAEAWEAIRLQVSPETTAGAVRQAALEQLLPGSADASAFDIKYLGALVDGKTTMADAGAVNGSMFLIIHHRRRPVR